MASQSIPSMTIEGTSNASVVMASREDAFFTAPTFAVVGASNDDTKAGAQILRYLKTQFGDRAITPVNPNRTEIQGLKCIKSIMDLSDAKHTAVSIVVNPKASLEVLQQARQLGIPNLWLQPGTVDAAVIAFIQSDADFESRCIYHTLPFSTNIKLSTSDGDSGSTTNPCDSENILNGLGQNPPLATSPALDIVHNSGQNGVIIGAPLTSHSTSPALDIVHNSGQNGVVIGAPSISHSTSPALDIVHNSSQNGVVIGAPSISPSTSPALDIVHNSGQNGVIIGAPSTSHSTRSAHDIVHGSGQNGVVVDAPLTSHLTRSTLDFVHNPAQNNVVIDAYSTSHSTSPTLDTVHNPAQNHAVLGISSTSSAQKLPALSEFEHGTVQNSGLVASSSPSPDLDHGSGQNLVPPSEGTHSPVVKKSFLTKRSRESEEIDTKSLKAAKTGPMSSPVTARSTKLHFALVKRTSIAFEEFKDTLLQKEQHFWSATKYAVIGASNDEHKFGYKCMKFLQDQKKDVVPINPNVDEVLGVKCLDSVAELSDPAHTAVSVVVHPEVTMDVLKYISLNKLSLFSLWLQPGAEDANVLKFIKDNGMEDYCVYAIGGSGPISVSSSTTATVKEAADSVPSNPDTTGPGCRFVVNNPSLLNMGTGANVDADGDKMEVSESMAVPEGIRTMTSVVTKKTESAIAAVRSAAANVQMHVPCILADGPKCLATVMGKGDAQVKDVRKHQTQCDEISGLA